MKKQRTSPCPECHGFKIKTDDIPDVPTCGGESWRCLFKKWHIAALSVTALIGGIFSELPKKAIDSLFEEDEPEALLPLNENTSSAQGFKIITTLGRLENGQEIAIIARDEPKKTEEKTIQISSVTETPPPLPQHITIQAPRLPNPEPKVHQ